MYERLRELFLENKIDEKLLNNAVIKGYITEEELNRILKKEEL